MTQSYSITGADFVALLRSKTDTIEKHVTDANTQKLDSSPLVCIGVIRAINELKSLAEALESQYTSHVMNYVAELKSKRKEKEAEKYIMTLKQATGED